MRRRRCGLPYQKRRRAAPLVRPTSSDLGFNPVGGRASAAGAPISGRRYLTERRYSTAYGPFFHTFLTSPPPAPARQAPRGGRPSLLACREGFFPQPSISPSSSISRGSLDSAPRLCNLSARFFPLSYPPSGIFTAIRLPLYLHFFFGCRGFLYSLLKFPVRCPTLHYIHSRQQAGQLWKFGRSQPVLSRLSFPLVPRDSTKASQSFEEPWVFPKFPHQPPIPRMSTLRSRSISLARWASFSISVSSACLRSYSSFLISPSS